MMAHVTHDNSLDKAVFFKEVEKVMNQNDIKFYTFQLENSDDLIVL